MSTMLRLCYLLFPVFAIGGAAAAAPPRPGARPVLTPSSIALRQVIAGLPTDFPQMLTHTELQQPNGRKINVHLVNFTTIGTYMLNQYTKRRNALTNDQRQFEEKEERAILLRHPKFSWLQPLTADAERQATLRGYASATERQAIEQVLQREMELLKQQDPGFEQQPEADKRAAFQVINDYNKSTGCIDYVRVRRTWDAPH